MIQVVLIEDEAPAARKMKRFLTELNEPVNLLAEYNSVTAAREEISSLLKVDLIIADVELTDGTIFELFDTIQVQAPVIFTTAYNQYLMDAFESNGIEYLLKPFSFDRFLKAWNKFLLLRSNQSDQQQLLEKVQSFIEKSTNSSKEFRTRFSITVGRTTHFLHTAEILFFRAEEGLVVAIDTKGKKHYLQHPTLREIEELLNPADFFRINRSELVHKKHIDKIERYDKNSIAISISGYENQLITSQSSTAAFKEWVEL